MEAIMVHKAQVSADDRKEEEIPEWFEDSEADLHEFEKDFEIAINMMEIGRKTGCSGSSLYRRAEQRYHDEHVIHHRL